jgi:hypothetical protein
MHVLHRPHLPRLISVSIAAAILTITISLALASGLSNINQPGNNTGPAVRENAPTLTVHTTAPRWASNPFAGLVSRRLPQLWRTSSR